MHTNLGRTLAVAATCALAAPHDGQGLRQPPGCQPVLNLGLAARAESGEDFALFMLSESEEDTDFNGDGDRIDSVPHVYEWRRNRLTNLGLATGASVNPRPAFIEGPHAVLQVGEGFNGFGDLNGDGDDADHVLHVHDTRTGITTNLGYSVVVSGTDTIVLREGLLVFRVRESAAGFFSAQAEDLNGDGDLADTVLVVHELASGITTPLWAATSGGFAGRIWVRDGLIAQAASEFSHFDQDLNDDGDRGDHVLHTYDVASGVTTNLGFSGTVCTSAPGRLAVVLSESNEGEDFNGDTDQDDLVLHRYELASELLVSENIASNFFCREAEGTMAFSVSEFSQGHTDLNGDGDDEDGSIMFTYVAATATLTNTGLPAVLAGSGASLPQLDGDLLVFWVEEDDAGETDLNGDGDTFDRVLHVHEVHARATTNLGLASSNLAVAKVNGRHVAFLVGEQQQGQGDLNGDGDDEGDWVAHVYDRKTGALTNLGLANFGARMALGPDFLMLVVDERTHGRGSLNDDADATDGIFHLVNISSLSVRNLQLEHFTSTSTLINYSATSSDLLFGVYESQERDLNGDGDRNDHVLHHLPLNARACASENSAQTPQPSSSSSSNLTL